MVWSASNKKATASECCDACAAHAADPKNQLQPCNSSVFCHTPTHVPWTGGVLGAAVDLTVKWETGLDGMRSSAGESEVLWRAWESREQNLARGVKPESMPK